MNFIQLRYFCVLAKLEHMTQAANTLHVAQSALSRTLRKLEQEVGVLLFDRVGTGIKLNEHGRVLLQHCEAAFHELDMATRILQDARNQDSYHVSLTMLAGSMLLPDIIRGFNTLYPNIILHIIQQGGSAQSEESDITIDATAKVVNQPGAMTLLEEEILLAMPQSNPLSTRKSIRLGEVANQPFIGLYRGKKLRTITDNYCLQAGFVPNIVLESDNPSTVREFIALDVGLAFIPRITWHGVGDHPGVSLVSILSPKCVRWIVMMWPIRRQLSWAAIQLRDYLANFFTQIA